MLTATIMAIALTHAQLSIKQVPARDDPSSKLLVNPVSQQRCAIPSTSELSMNKKGWGSIKHANGELTKVRDLLTWPVCKDASERLYIGLPDGSHYVDNMKQFIKAKYADWGINESSMARITLHEMTISIGGNYVLWDMRHFQATETNT